MLGPRRMVCLRCALLPPQRPLAHATPSRPPSHQALAAPAAAGLRASLGGWLNVIFVEEDDEDRWVLVLGQGCAIAPGRFPLTPPLPANPQIAFSLLRPARTRGRPHCSGFLEPVGSRAELPHAVLVKVCPRRCATTGPPARASCGHRRRRCLCRRRRACVTPPLVVSGEEVI